MEELHDLLGDVLAADDHLLGDGLAAADNTDDEGDDDWDEDWDAFGNGDNFGLAVPPHGYDDPLVVFRDLRLMGFGLADLNPDLAADVRHRLLQATTRSVVLKASYDGGTYPPNFCVGNITVRSTVCWVSCQIEGKSCKIEVPNNTTKLVFLKNKQH
jgi:hypothetical protein